MTAVRQSQKAGVVGLLSALACALWQTWALLPRFFTHLPRQSTDPLFHAWALHSWHRWLDAPWRSAPFEGNNFFPHAHVMAFSDTFLGQALVSWPAHLGGASPITAHNVAFVCMYALVAWGAYQAAWWTTRSIPAALVALAVTALAQHRHAFADHLNIMSGWLVAPALALWVQWLKCPRVRTAAAAGACAGVQWWFSGQLAVFFGVAAAAPVGLVTLAALVRADRSVMRTRLKGMATGSAVAAVTALPVVMAHVAVRTALGLERTLEANVAYSAPLREYLVSAQASALQRQFTSPAGTPLYPGAVAVGLALVSVLVASRWARRRRQPLDHPGAAWALFCTGALACLFSLGPVAKGFSGQVLLPYYHLLRAVPALAALRTPARFFVPMQAALGLLAALAVAYLAQRRPRGARWPSRLAWGVPMLVVWDLWWPPLRVQGTPARSPAMEALGNAHPGASVVEIADGRPENFDATWRAIFHNLNTTAGTSGTTPPLTGALRCRSNLFPLAPALDVFRAAGVSYVAVHRPGRPFVRSLPPPPLGVLQLPTGGGLTDIYWLGPPHPHRVDQRVLAGPPLPLRVASAWVPGGPVNAALDLAARVAGTAVSVNPAVPAEVVLTKDGRQLHQRTTLHLPAVLDHLHHHARMTFTAPWQPGRWDVEVRVAGTAVGAAAATVDPGVALGRDAATLSGITLELDARAWPWLTGRCGALGVTVRNTGSYILQAYAERMTFPAEGGKAVLDTRMVGPGGPWSNRAHQWQTFAAVLWHDLGPGDQGEATVEMPAPQRAGAYTLEATLSVMGRAAVARATTPVQVLNAPPPP